MFKKKSEFTYMKMYCPVVDWFCSLSICSRDFNEGNYIEIKIKYYNYNYRNY